ncbi:hypothetical protein [Ralstonia mannitolilytica]|uniref:hypothetical protein n=1 Tax=Ralstonia mannitolilytica TaxID=105219 RepID=UPI003B844E43
MTQAQTRAIQAAADHENLVGELVDALRPFVRATLTPTGQIIGLMREDFDRARFALAKAEAQQ